jgi:hypothetical protein
MLAAGAVVDDARALETLASSVASRAVPPGVVAANWERVTAGEPMALVWSLLASLLERRVYMHCGDARHANLAHYCIISL